MWRSRQAFPSCSRRPRSDGRSVKLRIHLVRVAFPPQRPLGVCRSCSCCRSLLHAASMFLFHATFPRSNGSPERSVSVTYVLPGSPEAAKLAPILAASDPALFSSAQVWPERLEFAPAPPTWRALTKKLPDLKPLPSPRPSQFLPPRSGHRPGHCRYHCSKGVSPREPAPPTTVQFGGALEKRVWTPPPKDSSFPT